MRSIHVGKIARYSSERRNLGKLLNPICLGAERRQAQNHAKVTRGFSLGKLNWV
jgi:hypothetical protein